MSLDHIFLFTFPASKAQCAPETYILLHGAFLFIPVHLREK
ncbi:hypothetical protein JMJ77_0001652 [Colletotrichum scovillei]|uniref:Uncharacterized protein n=1 Tax=Colletotrichum scovillei TaxID=1209932 RepID=A0A9P7R8V0_9PEZI|nr:hypothetical protein JMJ77_0001652 [Colletotrichum scovillei]KAG7070062.1 hypothetical protein JMJ76_0001319 [Colletotrichum scovillei]KAG7078312.1 hypothetical protein JMJ78_0001984 [Colletotrichum scovillei]